MSGRRGQSGFSLLEVLVSFALLAGSTGLLLAIVSNGMRQVRLAADATEMAAIAQSLLAPLGVTEALEAGAFAGESEDGRFRWQLRVDQVPDASLGAGLLAAGPSDEDSEDDEEFLTSLGEELGGPILYRIDLELAPAAASGPAARFSTLRLRVAPSP